MRSSSTLVGRDPQIASLRGAIRPGRVVAVTGAPGVGKSALIAEVMRDRERVVWVDLDTARTAEDLWAALGRSLGVNLDQPDRAAPRLARALQQAAVVVLDSAELLDDGAWTALEALRRDAPCAWVVGSVVGHESLGARLALEPLAIDDARAMLLARAADQALGRPIDEADPAWTALAERLDGLPLALELAAGRLGLASPAELLERIDVAVLRGEGRRHSIDGALRFAWGLLGEREKHALIALSPLRGGFTLPIAEGLLGADALLVLDALRARSAVVHRKGRLVVLEGLRRIAAEQADEAVRMRFVAFWGAYGARLRAMNIGTETVAGSRGLRIEYPNLRAAFELARGRDPLAAAQIATALVNALRLDGPVWEVDSLGDLGAVARAAPPAEGSELLAMVGGAQLYRGRARQARATLEEALSLADRVGPVLNGRALALCDLGWIALLDGKPDDARAAFLAAIDAAPDPSSAALGLMRLGAVEVAAGDPDAAIASLEACLDRLASFANLRLRGGALVNLGLLRGEQRRHVQAEDLMVRGIEDLRGVERATYATGLVSLALLRLVNGDAGGTAQGLVQEALALHEAYGSDLVAGETAVIGALERWVAGDHRAARDLLVRASAATEAADPRGAATVRAWRAALEADTRGRTPLRAELDAALADGANPQLVAVLAAFGGGDPPPPARAEPLEIQLVRRMLDRTPAALRLDRGGRWFERPGDRVDLARRGALRRILAALVDARVSRPGSGLSVQDLFEAGWPGERVLPEAASARVYNSVRELRSLGVGDVLRREAEGYLLDPAVRLDVDG